MGPNRQNWTFPYTGEELIVHLTAREADLAHQIDTGLDDEQLGEQKLAEFRDQMRAAGVIGWELMQLPKSPPWATYNGKADNARQHYGKLAKMLDETRAYRRLLEHEFKRDPARTFKLTFDDLTFLGL